MATRSFNNLVPASTVSQSPTELSYHLLASMGCDFAQGHYLAPPLPLAKLDT